MINTPEQVTGAESVVWDLSPLYNGVDDPAIDRDMQRLTTMADSFAARYKGSVGELDAPELLEAVQTLESIYDLSGRMGGFANLVYSTDTGDPRNGALLQKVTEFDAQLSQKLVFFQLEWNNAADEYVKHVLADPILANYRHALEADRRYKPYQLSEVEEQLLMEKDVTGRSAWQRFYTQLTSSMRYDFDGQKLTLTEVLTRLYDEDRDVRRKAADSITEGLRTNAMQITYIHNVLAADKASDDRLRGYPSWIASRNLSNKAPDAVVDALVQAVTSNYDIVAQHYNLKRRLLGLDDLYEYDRYAPLPLKESEAFYSWEEARSIVLNAFHAFSPEMGQIAQRFFDENWIHAALGPNKSGGAYANPVVPSVHPYVFVNYTGKARDVSTLAHELGHGIHMVLSAQQTLYNYYTPLTTAEMASVFAEMVVFNDLMQREADPEVRLSMLLTKIEDSFSTVFRQTAMNRFEEAFHTARREQGELTTEQFSEMWLTTQRAMFGDSVTLREEYGIWWTYIPHFIGTPGYVYAYAFGELLVLALFNLYQEEGASFIPKYLNVLAAGGNDYPEKILAQVGVDLNDPAFWNKGLDAIRSLVAQEEALAREVYPDKL
ncbi:MAG: M3 family oligoendopeptidase [bacterium]|nr:M3 family oligoendopeptidase [bacterium]